MPEHDGETVNVDYLPRDSRQAPVSVTAILDDAFNIVRRHFALLTGITALVIVPITLISNFVSSRAVPQYQEHVQQLADLSRQMQLGHAVRDRDLTDAAGALIRDVVKLLLIVGGFSLLQFAIVGSALVYAVASAYTNRTPSLRSSFRAASKCAVPVLGASLSLAIAATAILVVPATLAVLAGSAVLAVVCGLIAIVIAIFLAVRCTMYIQALVLEGRGPIAAIRRSYTLSSGYFWKTCGLLALTTVMVVLMAALAGTIVNHATGGNKAVQTLVTVLIGTAATPLVLCAQTLFYLELRTVSEYFETEHLITELHRHD